MFCYWKNARKQKGSIKKRKMKMERKKGEGKKRALSLITRIKKKYRFFQKKEKKGPCSV